jgi:hypothetical protein
MERIGVSGPAAAPIQHVVGTPRCLRESITRPAIWVCGRSRYLEANDTVPFPLHALAGQGIQALVDTDLLRCAS